MENVNGYFQVIRANDGTYVKLFPAEGKGKNIDINEIREYLEYNKIVNCSYTDLVKAVKNLSEQVVVKVSSDIGYPIDEYMKVTISDDNMKATARFYPPSNDGNRETVEEMRNDLSKSGVVFGIDERVFKFQIKNPLYCTDYVIAKGEPVKEGKNAWIEYFFNTDKSIKPKRNEDGTVDFHQLNNIGHIKEGDLLAKLHLEVMGQEGINVLGEKLYPHQVVSKSLKFGNNIRISDDRLEIYSEVNGHASLEGEMVFVDDMYEVLGDVDNNTGDIDYEGNIVIKGNVRTGFKIRSSGDVEVYGTVEGAEIISGGRVILHRGIQGMTKGSITAKGDVVTKFIESSKVYSEGNIESEEIIQSQVSAKGTVSVNGRRGQIIGGFVRATEGVIAKNIGSTMGITTLVEVGVDPEVQDRFRKLKTELTTTNEEYKKSMLIITNLMKKKETGTINTMQMEMLSKVEKLVKTYRQKMFDVQDEIDKISEEMGSNERAYVKVSGKANIGTQIKISGEFISLNDTYSYCRFQKSEGEIKRFPL